ncbi:MAG: hypothetical protein M3068_02335 [Gemmatimonadota bacterium]|nr:hypothetical protein [Gemmatimonadota bacterium]
MLRGIEIALPGRPMNVATAPGSYADRAFRARAGISPVKRAELVPGLRATPAHDLHFHGGRTIAHLGFVNYYIGGDASWQRSDIARIDRALAAAMADERLENVMTQYFLARPTTTFRGSRVLAGPPPARMSQGDVEALVRRLHGEGVLAELDLSTSVLDILLPRGTILDDERTPSKGERQDSARSDPRGRDARPTGEEADSLHGLGGYHGSVHIGHETIYYAVGVYSERRDGRSNGIPVFDEPWKNVVATFYHELNEARTDPDVQDVIDGAPMSRLGWTSRQGEECGDFPVVEARPLSLVFREVELARGGEKVPVQLQYSNAVHGPEGPVESARTKAAG